MGVQRTDDVIISCPYHDELRLFTSDYLTEACTSSSSWSHLNPGGVNVYLYLLIHMHLRHDNILLFL